MMDIFAILEFCEANRLTKDSSIHDLCRAMANADRPLDPTDRGAVMLATQAAHQRRPGGGSFSV
jgi:hypothetical protein